MKVRTLRTLDIISQAACPGDEIGRRSGLKIRILREYGFESRSGHQVRKDFTPSEAVAIARVIDEALKEKTAARRSENSSRAGKISAAKRAGNALDVNAGLKQTHVEPRSAKTAAEAVGLTHTTYFAAKKVVKAAEQNPTRFGDLVDAMDRTL